MAEAQGKKTGGLVFFTSLALLALVAPVNFSVLPVLSGAPALKHWLLFTLAALGGFIAARTMIRGHLSVLLHEQKHWILASLAGNKFKSMRIRKRSGHLEYSYTARTAAYNAFIALAPYMLPMATVLFLLTGLLITRTNHTILVTLSAFGIGVDASLNTRDIGVHQSDITGIRGGFPVGLLYIALMNVALFSFYAAWLSGGTAGLALLAQTWWALGFAVLEALRG